jgi:hypothetical protein
MPGHIEVLDRLQPATSPAMTLNEMTYVRNWHLADAPRRLLLGPLSRTKRTLNAQGRAFPLLIQSGRHADASRTLLLRPFKFRHSGKKPAPMTATPSAFTALT